VVPAEIPLPQVAVQILCPLYQPHLAGRGVGG
jgi:hypothetical protein